MDNLQALALGLKLQKELLTIFKIKSFNNLNSAINCCFQTVTNC